MKTLWFDGESAAANGLIISGSGTFDAPERDVEMVSIPGRNGDLIIDNGRYKNISVSYPASIYTDFASNAEKARAWLGSRTGYCRLEDDYDPDHFRLARFKGPLRFTPGFLNRTAECTITFDCKPQRFLKSGEAEISVTNGCSIVNPTMFPAKPLLIITCTSAIALFTVKGANGSYHFDVDTSTLEEQVTVYLDTEDGSVYTYAPDSGVRQNRPSIGSMDLGKDVLVPGVNIVSVGTLISGSVAAVQIVPRWWTL